MIREPSWRFAITCEECGFRNMLRRTFTTSERQTLLRHGVRGLPGIAIVCHGCEASLVADVVDTDELVRQYVLGRQ